MTKPTWEDGPPVEPQACSVCKTRDFVYFLTREGQPACEVCAAESHGVTLDLIKPARKAGPERFEFVP